MSKTVTFGILTEHQMLHIHDWGGSSNLPGAGGGGDKSTMTNST